jgi:O-acetyl-ADP-ribose deacetylase (regulator of RNase III)
MWKISEDLMISEQSTSAIQHLTFDSSMAWEKSLRILTAQAGQAAELGHWDQVEECYRLRGEHLLDHPMFPALATGLIVFDQKVAARIANAQLAVQSQLIETAKVRQNLQGVRSWQGLSETESSRMDQLA